MDGDALIPAAYLYLHQMDATDLQLYKHRLAKAILVVEKSHDQSEPSKVDGSVRYRTQTTQDAYYTAHVRLITKPNGLQLFHLWTDHTDGCSNFTICDRIRPGEKPIDPSDPISILEHLDLLQEEAALAFSDYGVVGGEHLAAVEEKDRRCLEIINALIHAYIEFAEGKRFVLEIHANKPYSRCNFFERVDKIRYNFLTEAMIAKIDEFMPSVCKIEYSRNEGMSLYDIGPLDPQEIIITAEDMPTGEEIRKILLPIASVPAPHLLDEFTPAEMA